MYLGMLSRARGGIEQATDVNGYFEELGANPACVKRWSLRPVPGDTDPHSPFFEDMLASDDDGGLHAFGCNPATWAGFNYDATVDAARGNIKSFLLPECDVDYKLTAAIVDTPAPDTEQTISVSKVTSTYTTGRSVKIDNEIMEVTGHTNGTPGTVSLLRGQNGTTPATHAIGADVPLSTNQVINYLVLPLLTTDGHVHVITWDNLWDESYMHIGEWDAGQKTFQFTNGDDTKLFEPKLMFSGLGEAGFDPDVHIAVVGGRSYNSVNNGTAGQDTWPETNGNTMGPGWSLVGGADLTPRAGDFFVRPNKWTRFWVVVDQRANDWDYFDMYVADEDTEPVKVYDQVALSVSGGGANQRITNMWFELGNSNGNFVRGGVFDLISYHRNVVHLQDPASVAALLVNPVAA